MSAVVTRPNSARPETALYASDILGRPTYTPPLPEAVPVAVRRTANVALAGLQLLIGYQWLVSGVDKLLYGSFPDRVGSLLQGTLHNSHIPSAFADMMQTLVLPNATLFGVFIMWAETLAGAGLVAGGLVTLARPMAERRLSGPLAAVFALGARLLDVLAPLAALGTLALGLNYWVMDGMPSLGFTPNIAYGGAIDAGMFLALGSVAIAAGALANRRASRAHC
jgi:uncharacterized membrane protein YphA (DoxX/SURF4 family)